MLYLLSFSIFLNDNVGPAEVRIVVRLLLLADLGLYYAKGYGTGLLGEGALGKGEGNQHQLWESTQMLPLPLQRIMFIHLESRNCC